jgi:hypothetical protein
VGQRRFTIGDHEGVTELEVAPAPWIDFVRLVRPELVEDGKWLATLYLGFLKSHGGHERLVAIQRRPDPRGESDLGHRVYVWVVQPVAPGVAADITLKTAPIANAKSQVLSWDRHTFSLFQGIRDKDDASHIEIPYCRDAERGTIDGWFGDDDQVFLEYREGPAARLTKQPSAGPNGR